MKKLEKATYTPFYKNMKLTWDINTPVWYPLAATNREDILAFDFNEDPAAKEIFLKKLKQVLSTYRTEHLYQLGEAELGFTPYKLTLNELHISAHHIIEDTFWCDQSLEWIIYACHDGYITSGGNQLLNELKEIWTEWNKYTVDQGRDENEAE
ncbi:hypothetical protein ACOJQI_21300 [Bacillus salacetis]|uniref:hypothetical protein n=1 Tax=Bacillus salacetis TaxID=2315464 RepID=UPI003BA39C8E